MFHLTTVEPEAFHLLQEIFSIPFIRKNFALAGGTALALHIGHRNSIDLDIFSTENFDVAALEAEIIAIKNREIEITGKNKRMLFCYINSLKCDFVHEPAKLISTFIPIENSFLFSIEDIGAMKLHTICGRGKKKDFFDIYALLQLYEWKDLIKWFKIKYSETELYFLWRSIMYFEDAEADFEIKGYGNFNANWKEIKEFIKKTCVVV